MVTFFDSLIAGILQGIFEWLPVSSEGVVAVFLNLFSKAADPVDLALFLHLGTLLAVLIYFRKDWIKVLALKDMVLFRFLFVSTLVSLPFGYLFYKTFDQAAVGAGLLALTGAGLLLTSFFQKRKIESDSAFWDKDKLAVFAGFLQGLSVIPGLSRSGSTIFALSLGKIPPQQILRISYMMSAPAVTASTIFLILSENSFVLSAWPALVFSFLAGFLFLRLLIEFSKKIDFSRFTLVFGILCLAGAFLEAIM
jgi:undecaprenyl-diphosphatase